MSTVAQIFSQLGLLQWWNQPVTQGYGQNGEKGTDFGLGGMGKPVGSISSGKVVYVGDGGYSGSSIGQIVQVLTPDGKLIHYQHLKDASVTVGETVTPGNVIGHGGGCPVGAYFADPSNNGCTRYDQFSTGQHIEVRESDSYNPGAGVWSQHWNPNNLAVFQALGTTNGSYVPLSSTFNSGSGSQGQVFNIDWGSLGTKIGAFVFGLVLLLLGLYILFQQQIDGAVKSTAKTAAKAVLV